jgi:hypothetical protein
MIPLALEFLQALELRDVGGRKAAHSRDQVTRRDLFTFVGAHPPQVGYLLEFCTGHARIELHVALEVVAFGHMLEITQNLGLLGIALGPFPFLQQLPVPGEAIDVRV